MPCFNSAAIEWEQGAQVYELRTNRNPRRTALLPEKDWEQAGTCLKPTGENYYQKVLSFIKAHSDEKHAVFCYKCVIEEKQAELDALGVVTDHYYNIAGLDTKYQGVKYFHILFDPQITPFGIDDLAKKAFGDDDEPLIRDDDGNLKRDADGGYEDERAQLCFDAIVVAELMQSVGRARLGLYPNTVFIWNSRFLPAITDRTETQLFLDDDWDTADNDLEKLSQNIKDTEQREAEANKAVADGDVDALANSQGVSGRWARELTKEQRQANKTEQKATARRLRNQGASLRDIAQIILGDRKKHVTIINWLEE